MKRESMQILRSHSGRWHGSRGSGLASASLLRCPGGKRSRATQGHAWCCLPGSSGPPGMLTRRPSPGASLCFQERAATLPGEASQPPWLWGQAAYLNPGRKALTVTGLPPVKTAHFTITGRRVFRPNGPLPCHCRGLSQGPALTAPPCRLERDEAAYGASHGGASGSGVARWGLFVGTSGSDLDWDLNLL